MTEAGTTYTVCIHCGEAKRSADFNDHHCAGRIPPSAQPEEQAA